MWAEWTLLSCVWQIFYAQALLCILYSTLHILGIVYWVVYYTANAYLKTGSVVIFKQQQKNLSSLWFSVHQLLWMTSWDFFFPWVFVCHSLPVWCHYFLFKKWVYTIVSQEPVTHGALLADQMWFVHVNPKDTLTSFMFSPGYSMDVVLWRRILFCWWVGFISGPCSFPMLWRWFSFISSDESCGQWTRRCSVQKKGSWFC